MSKIIVYNTTDSPVVINDKGSILGGKERGELEDTDQIKSAVEDGTLIKFDAPKADPPQEPDQSADQQDQSSKTRKSRDAQEGK